MVLTVVSGVVSVYSAYAYIALVGLETGVTAGDPRNWLCLCKCGTVD